MSATHVEFDTNAVCVFRDYYQTTVIAKRGLSGWSAVAYRGSIIAPSTGGHHLTALAALKDAHRVADKASRYEA